MSTSPATKKSTLDQAAFGVTVTFGVLSGLFWIWSSVAAGGSGFAESAANVTATITAIGGVAMGLLYLRRRLSSAS